MIGGDQGFDSSTTLEAYDSTGAGAVQGEDGSMCWHGSSPPKHLRQANNSLILSTVSSRKVGANLPHRNAANRYG